MNIDIHCGDSLDILKSVLRYDCIVTDPPYKLISGGNTTGEMGGCFSVDNYDNSGSIVDCDIEWSDFMQPLFDGLTDPGHAYFMANNRNVYPMLKAAEESGFYFHNLLVWDKITATPNRWYMKNCEFIGFFSKGKAFNISDCSQKQLIRCPQEDKSGAFSDDSKSHPTEKPVALMQAYIENSTKLGDTVIDPFMGSGSTAIAALNCGRKFIGIEKNEKYFNMAKKRIDDFCNGQTQAAMNFG